MTLIEQIKSGSDKLIHESAQTSEGEPFLAIAQLLVSAACLAKTIKMTPKDFDHAVTLAMSDTFYAPSDKSSQSRTPQKHS